MKELYFKQNKGFFGLLLTGIMFVVVGIIFIMNGTMSTPESLYNSGSVYGKKTLKQGVTLSVAITATSGEMTTQDGNAYYIIETEDEEYIALEVPEKFTQFNKEDGSEFNPPLKLAVKVGKWNVETQRKWYKVAENFNIEDDFEEVYFLSTVDYDNSKMWITIFSIGSMLLGAVIVFSGFRRRTNNTKSYDDLVIIYPELKDNLTLLKTDGIFASDVLNFYVYKNHLISMKNGFDTLDLSQVSWMDFSTTNYRGNITAQLPYLLIGETKQKSLAFGNYGKKHSTDMQQFFEMLEQHFSNIALGSENRPEKAGGSSNKKTISEFVAEQEAKRRSNDGTQEMVEKDNNTMAIGQEVTKEQESEDEA